MIPDHIKEQVKTAADIVEVVSDHVKLKRSGNGFTGLCPFHNEKSPSFHVSPHLGIYKCFGCGESGDVFSFLMKLEGVSFTDAIRQLGQRFGIDVPEEERPENDEQFKLKEGIFHALAFAGKYYHKQLTSTKEGMEALAYLETRGMQRGTIRSYGLGYAPDRFDGLLNAAADAGVNELYLSEAGLIKYGRNGESAFDAFRHRLMFPIFNASGRVIGFGGRILAGSDGKTPKNTAKYINTSQTKVYNKSEVLYGIHAAKNEIRKHSEVILVEGYTDVLSMHQAEIKNVVATSGTALTNEQLKILHRYTDNLLMIYDADNAGQNAMARGLDLALAEGLNVRLLHLPDGEDPDTYIQKHKKQGFLDYKTDHAQDFVSFFIEKARLDKQWDDPINRKKTISRILTAIARVPDEISRETYLQKLSELANLGTRALFEELNVHVAQHSRDAERTRTAEARERQRNSQPPPRRDPSPSATSAAGSRSTSPPRRQNSSDSPPDYLTAGPDNEAWTPAGEKPPYPDFDHDESFNSYQSGRRAAQAEETARVANATRRRPPYERELLRLMLIHMHPMVEYVGSQCNSDYFEDESYRLLFDDLVLRYNEGLPISVAVYMDKEAPFPELVGEIMVDRFSTSDRVKEKLGKKIHRDGNPYRTAKGELRSLKMYYLDRVKSQLQQSYSTANTNEDKVEIQQHLLEVSRHRLQLETESLDKLFPNPEDI
jgi:DNA primase